MYFTERKATGILIFCAQFITLCIYILIRPRSPKMPVPLSVSNYSFMCIINFSSSFPLSHLSHCISVHQPPTFTHSTNHASAHRAILLTPLFPLSLDQISHSGHFKAQYFKCFILWNTNTNTHDRIYLNLYNLKCLLTSPTLCVYLFHLYEQL